MKTRNVMKTSKYIFINEKVTSNEVNRSFEQKNHFLFKQILFFVHYIKKYFK